MLSSNQWTDKAVLHISWRRIRPLSYKVLLIDGMALPSSASAYHVCCCIVVLARAYRRVIASSRRMWALRCSRRTLTVCLTQLIDVRCDRRLHAVVGRGDDTVGNPHRAQIFQFELFELIL